MGGGVGCMCWIRSSCAMLNRYGMSSDIRGDNAQSFQLFGIYGTPVPLPLPLSLPLPLNSKFFIFTSTFKF
jgi:hypothetical protein